MIKPFTVDECQMSTAKCYAEALDISQMSHFESSGVNVFGWRDERRVFDGGRFNFSIKKFFSGYTAAELSLATWWLSCTPRLKMCTLAKSSWRFTCSSRWTPTA